MLDETYFDDVRLVVQREREADWSVAYLAGMVRDSLHGGLGAHCAEIQASSVVEQLLVTVTRVSPSVDR